jgi:hypothetical protein
MTLKDRDWARIGAGTGFGFVILLVLAYLLGPNDAPGFSEPASTVASYVANNDNEIRAGSALVLGSLLFFAFFIGSLAAHNRRAEKDGRLSATAHAGGITAIAVAAGAAAVSSAAASTVQSVGAADPNAGIVEALFTLGGYGFAAAAIGTAILQYATGVLALRFGSFVSWYGLVSIAAGLYTGAVAIIAIASRDNAFNPYDGALPTISLLVLAVWVLLTSVFLIQRAR